MTIFCHDHQKILWNFYIRSHRTQLIALERSLFKKKVDSLIIGKARRSFPLLHMLRGTTVRDVARYLPDDIKFIVVY